MLQEQDRFHRHEGTPLSAPNQLFPIFTTRIPRLAKQLLPIDRLFRKLVIQASDSNEFYLTLASETTEQQNLG